MVRVDQRTSTEVRPSKPASWNEVILPKTTYARVLLKNAALSVLGKKGVREYVSLCFRSGLLQSDQCIAVPTLYRVAPQFAQGSHPLPARFHSSQAFPQLFRVLLVRIKSWFVPVTAFHLPRRAVKLHVMSSSQKPHFGFHAFFSKRVGSIVAMALRLERVLLLSAFCCSSMLQLNAADLDTLAAGWSSPPDSARLRAYWWWLNGNVTSNAIRRDLEEMRKQGFGGALICDAGGAEQGGNATVKHGPTFMTPEWRNLYKFTLSEAHRLGLEMSLNIQSGWNLGGPDVTAGDAVKKLVWSETVISGAQQIALRLPQAEAKDGYYRDARVLAYPLRPVPVDRAPLKNWEIKAMRKPLEFTGPNAWFLANSAPDTTALTQVESSVPGEEDARIEDIRDLTASLSSDGTLRWDVPAGRWQIIRFGTTLADNCHVSTSSDGWKGYALDVLDDGAFRRYWDAVVEPLIADAGPLAGTTLRYLHTDSWEIDLFNWTPAFIEEFKNRRGYDPTPWLPVMAGRILNSREESHRFLADFRKTLGDLAIDHHYALFKQWAARHGLGIHPESGGPHYTPIDAQRALGIDDVPMSEFWAESRTHRSIDATRFFVKQPASAAHTYGRQFVAAEGFTTVGPHWQETIWDNLKPSFDKALCEGLNRLFWHAFVCSPEEEGMPGIQYFAGTHFNPNVTWWNKSAPFLAYINRCQWMLQQGRFVADALYYYGDHVPNFAQSKNSDPARVLPGYDYDVVTEELLLSALRVENGFLTLPDGMRYRALVLPNRTSISLPALRKIQQLVEAGATIIGARPQQATGLQGYPENDREVQRLANGLWSPSRETRPHVIADKTARDVFQERGLPPDFEYSTIEAGGTLDYIHRSTGAAEIYFIANRAKTAAVATCTFRVTGKAPELWNPVTGEQRFADAYSIQSNRTSVSIEFEPCGSWFVVFRQPVRTPVANSKSNSPEKTTVVELGGPWEVHFDPQWGGPEAVEFDQLVDWTTRSEPGIRFYSGTATYRKTFVLPADAFPPASTTRIKLSLGDVRELAELKVNGESAGIVWAPPFEAEITKSARPGTNTLEVEVVNFWPNRIIGDASLPQSERFTRTNVRQLTRNTPLMPSGLVGPVRVVRETR